MNGDNKKQEKQKEKEALVDLENLNQKRRLQNKVLKRMVEQLKTSEKNVSVNSIKFFVLVILSHASFSCDVSLYIGVDVGTGVLTRLLSLK